MAVLALAAFAGAGCGLAGRVVSAPLAAVHSSSPPQLVVTIAPDANGTSPVAVDLLLVCDSRLLKTLSQMTAADWFKHRAALELDYTKKVEVLSWEWVPGQTIAPIPLELPGGLKGALVFADYNNPTAKGVAVNPDHGLVLALLTDDFAVHPAP